MSAKKHDAAEPATAETKTGEPVNKAQAEYECAVDCVAAATRKLADAGVGGQAAGQLALDIWKATAGK